MTIRFSLTTLRHVKYQFLFYNEMIAQLKLQDIRFHHVLKFRISVHLASIFFLRHVIQEAKCRVLVLFRKKAALE